MAHRAVNVVQLLQPEQPDPEGLEIRALVALQRHAGGSLQALAQEFLAGLDVRVIGVTDHHPRRLEAGRRNTRYAFAHEQGTHFVAQFLLLGTHLLEAVAPCLLHHVAQARQGVGRHGGVVGMAAGFVSLHDLQPLAQVTRKTAAAGAVDARAGQVAQHHHGTTRRTAPAFLRCADQYIDAAGHHVDPDRARRNAVQHQQATHGMYRIGHAAHIAIGQDHAGRGFHVRRKHQVRLVGQDAGHDFFHRRRRKGRLFTFPDAARLQDYGLGRYLAHLENLGPAVAEPAIADHQHLFVVGKLARHGFHAKGAAARHQHRRTRVVHLFQNSRDVFHDTLKTLRHVVERAVGVDDREFEQPVRVDVG